MDLLFMFRIWIGWLVFILFDCIVIFILLVLILLVVVDLIVVLMDGVEFSFFIWLIVKRFLVEVIREWIGSMDGFFRYDGMNFFVFGFIFFGCVGVGDGILCRGEWVLFKGVFGRKCGMKWGIMLCMIFMCGNGLV